MDEEKPKTLNPVRLQRGKLLRGEPLYVPVFKPNIPFDDQPRTKTVLPEDEPWTSDDSSSPGNPDSSKDD